MEAPSICVLFPDVDPALEEAALLDVQRYGFDQVVLVDAAKPHSAPAGLKVSHVASVALVDWLRDTPSRSEDSVMLVRAGRSLVRFNWLDLVPRLASRPLSSIAIAFASTDPESPVAALIRRDALGLVESTDPLAALARQADSLAVFYDAPDPPLDQARPAVFFDRDGVINADYGYVGDVSRFDFLPDAIAGVKAANDRGAFAFLVTNQSGVARGYYTEQDVAALHHHMTTAMRREGAHFDEIRTCPHLADGAIASYRIACRCRKPEPGMLLDLMRLWPIETRRSVLIGDKDSDMRAAAAAGVRGKLFTGGRLSDLVIASLTEDGRPVERSEAAPS